MSEDQAPYKVEPVSEPKPQDSQSKWHYGGLGKLYREEYQLLDAIMASRTRIKFLLNQLGMVREKIKKEKNG